MLYECRRKYEMHVTNYQFDLCAVKMSYCKTPGSLKSLVAIRLGVFRQMHLDVKLCQHMLHFEQ